MPKLSGPVVGITFTENMIYAVALRPGAGTDTPQVTQVGSQPLPPGTIADGAVQHVGVLSTALRTLMTQSGITARAVVVGLPSRGVFTRSITIPPVPEKERRAVIRGEIDHLNILSPGQGAFDYAPLARNENAAAAAKGEPVLFFAAETDVIEGYRAAVQEAGLQLVAMEPSSFGAIRTVYPGITDKRLALAVSLGSYHTNLLFFRDGRPVYSRRLDTGMQQMTVPEVSTSPTGREGGWQMFDLGDETEAVHELGQSAEAAEQMAGELFGDKLGKAGAARETLALEIGRSLEYYRREFGDDIDDVYIALLPNNLELAGLPVYMAAALDQDVHFVYAFEHIQAPGLPQKFLAEESVAYAPALGVALGPQGGRFKGMPRFDLSIEDAAVVRARQAPLQFRRSLVASAALLLTGAIGAVVINTLHAPVRTDLAAARQEQQAINTREQTLIARQEQHQNLVYSIQSQNVPWTSVLRHLGNATPPGVGVSSVTTNGQTLSISAEAASYSLALNFVDRLNQSGFFSNASFPSYSFGLNGRTTFQGTASLPQPTPPAPVPTLEELAGMKPLRKS